VPFAIFNETPPPRPHPPPPLPPPPTPPPPPGPVYVCVTVPVFWRETWRLRVVEEDEAFHRHKGNATCAAAPARTICLLTRARTSAVACRHLQAEMPEEEGITWGRLLQGMRDAKTGLAPAAPALAARLPPSLPSPVRPPSLPRAVGRAQSFPRGRAAKGGAQSAVPTRATLPAARDARARLRWMTPCLVIAVVLRRGCVGGVVARVLRAPSPCCCPLLSRWPPHPLLLR